MFIVVLIPRNIRRERDKGRQKVCTGVDFLLIREFFYFYSWFIQIHKTFVLYKKKIIIKKNTIQYNNNNNHIIIIDKLN